MFIFYLQKNFYYLSGRFQTLGNNFRTEENILEIIIFLRKSRIFWFYLSFLRCTWVFLSFFKFWFLKSQANKLFCRVKPTKFFAWSSQVNEFFLSGQAKPTEFLRLVKPSRTNNSGLPITDFSNTKKNRFGSSDFWRVALDDAVLQ